MVLSPAYGERHRECLGYVRTSAMTASRPTARSTPSTGASCGCSRTLFLPSMKLFRTERVGSRVRRRYDVPRTPLERVPAGPDLRPEVAAHLQRQRDSLDPFALARAIEQQL